MQPAADRVQNRLTDFACALNFAGLPPEVVHAAKARLIDTLGVLIGGFDGEPCRVARAVAVQTPAGDGATIIGTSFKTAPDLAAFANATTARYAELTDIYHWPGSAFGHPSDVIAPVLAAAEHVHASGRELIAAVVLAYEIFCRLSDEFRNKGFDPANFSCIAVAAAAARLLGLAPHGLAQSIAIAAVSGVILRQVRVDELTMFKVAAAGQAGRSGVFAALLARAGMEGPQLPFEGREGWCANVARDRLVLDELGGGATPFRILATRLKSRPCAGNTISSVLAAEKIAPLADAQVVERVTVEVYARAKIASGSDAHFWRPDSPETADHSIPYLVAVTLLEGTIWRNSFDDAHLRSAAVHELMAKIEVRENADYTRDYLRIPQAHRTRVTVKMRDGRMLAGETGGGADDLAAPATDAQIGEKFNRLAASALGTGAARRALDALWQIEALPDVASIPPLFVIRNAGG